MTPQERDLITTLLDRLKSVGTGQPNVQQDKVVSIFGKFFETLFAGGHSFGRETFVFEDAFQRLPDAGLVIDNEDSWHTGSSTTNRVPLGEFGSAAIYPP